MHASTSGVRLDLLSKNIQTESENTVSLFGHYYITKQIRQIAANLAIYAAFLVVKIISIDHFLLLTIISSHSMSIKSKKLEFFPKFQKFAL